MANVDDSKLNVNAKIAQSLKQYMDDGRFSVKDLSEKYGINMSAIYKWLRGEACPNFANLILLADEFKCPLDCLLGRRAIDDDYGFVAKTPTRPFCENLNAIMLEKGMTEYRIVKTMKASRNKVSSWRKGVSLPDAKGIYDLSDVLDVSADYLVGRE